MSDSVTPPPPSVSGEDSLDQKSSTNEISTTKIDIKMDKNDIDKELLPEAVTDDSLCKTDGPASNSRIGRSFSDRRSTASRTPSIGPNIDTVNASNQFTSLDMQKRKNSRSSKRSLYASFKYIDDYSPLASQKGVVNDSGDFKTDISTKDSSKGHKRSVSLSQEHSSIPQPAHHIRRISIRPSIDSMAHSLDVQCGIGPYRPTCLQRFADKNWMLFWLCWFCAVQGMLVSGLVPSVLSTIERRFNFKAASLGRIMQWYDIGYALCCVPVSYFGGRHSKPLFIGFGLLIMGAGSLIFSLPHIISDAHIYQERTENLGSCLLETVASSLEKASFGLLNFDVGSSSGNQTSLFGRCELFRQQQESFFAVILTGTFRFEIIFCFAHLLHGIGATPLFTLGVSYIDENVKPTLSSLYIGVFYTFVIIGPAAGFLMSGTFLRYHTDFLSAEKPLDILESDESDPYWVGAWWIGFQIASILSLFAVFPILSFPKTLPGALEWQRSRKLRTLHRKISKISTGDIPGSTSARNHKRVPSSGQASVAGSSNSAQAQLPPATVLTIDDIDETKKAPLWQRLLQDFRHIPSAVRRLITNPTYMCITLAASVEGLLITGLSGFMAKYLERQFNVASSRANMLIGCIMVPVAGLGTLASGYIVKRFRLTCAKTLKFCIAMAVFSLMLSPMFLVLCDPAKLSGVQVPYPMDDVSQRNSTFNTISGKETLYLKSRCNNHCSCSENEFRPVCGSVDGKQVAFFTSCFAGCPEPYHRTKKVYNNCTCVEGNSVVTAGWCESKCSALVGFLILFAPMCLCVFSIGVPALSVVLRCVDYNERSFALGIQWILIRCIGTIPAPAIFAWLFDISCLKRRRTADNECGMSLSGGGGSDGSCYLYDNKLLADLFLAFALIGQTVTLIFFIMASIFYRGNGTEDLIVSEAPPLTPAVVQTYEEVTTSGGTPTRFVLEPTGKDGTTVKRL